MTAGSAWSTFRGNVAADWRAVRAYRAKYNAETLDRAWFPAEVAKRVGLQMMVGVRLMGLARDLRIPVLPMVLSRLIRHLYSAEIHWEAVFEPGVSLIHGNGLVVGRGVHVSSDVLLFQHVTLGESMSATTRAVGSPVIGTGVHVMPGAVILGPIEIGRGSKIGPNAVVTTDVPARCVVTAAAPSTTQRPILQEVRDSEQLPTVTQLAPTAH